jgi:hypothetical protein
VLLCRSDVSRSLSYSSKSGQCETTSDCRGGGGRGKGGREQSPLTRRVCQVAECCKARGISDACLLSMSRFDACDASSARARGGGCHALRRGRARALEDVLVRVREAEERISRALEPS